MKGGAATCINGEELALLTGGAVYWPAQDALIVADLHFEKGSSFATKGVLLPPYDTRATLKRLTVLCDALKPKRIFSLGDAFHDGGAETRMDDEDARLLINLMSAHDWVWILGNHDPAPPSRFKGAVEHALREGGLYLTHEPSPRPQPGEIAGHLHPCAKVKTSASTLRRRCFVGHEGRMILPAFGAYTGGLNVLDNAFAPLFPKNLRVWAMGREAVYAIARRSLVRDGASLSASRGGMMTGKLGKIPNKESMGKKTGKSLGKSAINQKAG